jgi:hypothetical protein
MTAYIIFGTILAIMLPVATIGLLAQFNPQNYMTAVVILMTTKVFVTVMFLFTCSLLIKFLSNTEKLKQFMHTVTISHKDRDFTATGYLDTGNMLCHPTDKTPIVVISLDLYMKMFPIHNGDYINFSTVGKSGKMLVFKPAKFVVDDKPFDVSVGVSMKNFNGNLKYDVLLNANII